MGTQPELTRRAFFGEGIEGVGQQVAEHLTQTGFPGLDPQGRSGQIADQFDFHAAPPFGQQRQRIVQRRLQGDTFRSMAIASGEGAQVRDDRGHAPGQFADQFEVATGIVGALVVEQHFGVFRVAADRGQWLIEFVADARGHCPQRREFAGLHQIILGANQFLLRLFALQHFLFQSTVEPFQITCALGDPAFQFAPGLAFEGDPFQVMTAALHHQAEQQHQHQQHRATDGDHRAHRAVDQRARGKNADVPAGFRDRLGLGQPGIGAELQWLRIAGRIRLNRADGFALVLAQRAGRAEAPFRA
ncbi:hypothetical protein D3C87_1273720 [compost metagenome]